MKRGVILVAVSVFLAGVGTATGAIQDQVQSTRGSTIVLRTGLGKQDFAQTFQPSIAGRLEHIEHNGYGPGSGTEYPTIFTITDTVGGVPGTNVLGQTVVTNLSEQSRVYFSNQEVYLQSEVTYALVLRTDAPVNGWAGYWFPSSRGDTYSRGALWSRVEGGLWSIAYQWNDPAYPSDLVFATYMEPGIPPVRILQPADAVTIEVGAAVKVTAAVSPEVTGITEIAFYAGSLLLGGTATPPYEITWVPSVEGKVDLVAVLRRADGVSLTSIVHQVTVTLTRPSNDDFARRTPLNQEYWTSDIDQVNASVEPGEPRPFPESAGKSVWWQWTPPRQARATFVVLPVQEDNALLGLFTGAQVNSLFLLTNHASGFIANVQLGTTYQIAVDCLSNELSGTSLAVALNDLEIILPQANAVFHAPASFTVRAQRTAEVRKLETVELIVDGDPTGRLPLGSYELPCVFPDPGNHRLHLAVTDTQGIRTLSEEIRVAVRPKNDDFEMAQVISGRAAVISATNVAATMQVKGNYPWEPRTGEPTWADNQGGHSIWYRWTAPADGICVIDGAGDSFALLFNVCLGATVDSLSVVAGNAVATPYDRVQFDTVAGRTYFISVDGYFGEEGALDWSLHLKPYNDDFADRRLLAGLSAGFFDSNEGATTESGEASFVPAGTGSSLWYSWQAPIHCQVNLSVAGTTPVAVAIFEGASFTNLVPVTSSPAGWTNAPTVRFSAVRGVTYQIALFGQEAAAGTFSLQLACQGLHLVSPLPNSVLSTPAMLRLAAQLEVEGQSLREITFKANGEAIGVAAEPPFTLDWKAPGTGTYTLSASARTTDGTAYESPPLTCLVYSDRQLPRPRVYSGVSSDSSHVINAVGALSVFGAYPNQFGRTDAIPPSTPFLGVWPTGVTGWKEISGTWALSDSGKLYRDGLTPVDFPPGVKQWKHVSQGFDGVVTVGDDGNVYLRARIWDPDSQIPVPSPPGGWRDARAALTSVNEAILALGEDREAYVINYYNGWNLKRIDRPTGVAGWESIAQAALFGVLLGDNGEVYTYTLDPYGHGTGSIVSYSRVPRPTGVTRWTELCAGGYHVLAIGDNGQLYAWGRNWEHQLGLGLDQNTRATPVLVDPPAGVTGWSSIAAGQFHSLAIGNDCSVYAWGSNNSGQVGQPISAPLSRPARVASLEALCGTPILFTDGKASRLPDGTFMLQFSTDLNRSYLIQYSDDLETWRNATPSVRGTGELVEWLDDGPPKTEVHPSTVAARAYRVVYAP